MKLSESFVKPIDRHIDGVIKADDEASLLLEVEEYILTDEVAHRLEAFLRAYNEEQGANGVWISGFFGSGKSHLLKMLAFLLENRTVEGRSTLDLFLAKEMVHNNAFLRGDLTRAAQMPSRSILFNIDQKADVISKEDFDALLSVFVKVFDEACGYYGKQGYIAQFEREMDQRGQYEPFKAAYQDIAHKPWERGREVTLLEGHNIAQAYARTTGNPADSAQNILDKYRKDYRVSIEDFAKQVNAYVEAQGKGFRLNFLADEVGQYIAGNVKLMTNLQTIAESLATHCRGRAWLIVTAQEDMNSVLGEAGGQQTNDFSKIQDRFKVRLKLTSANVEEVIRKRLLFKNPAGVEAVAALYHAHQNNFKTLFSLVDGAKNYRSYADLDHFVHTYPFVPYQFPLFQAAIENLSVHSAFEGRHSSVGERSMLEVFQDVAKAIADEEVGRLATFDLMYEGIRAVLKSQIQRAVITAEEHLGDAFAVRVLKALFLVKYVKEFKATARNLTVLMVETFDVDLPALAERVQTALDLLEQQTYLQRSGEIYEYLTDEEKDVEQEIKSTEVEREAVAKELAELIFDRVLGSRKIRYQANGQDYSFTRKLDDTLHSREQELAIHVISPFHQHAGNDTVLRSQTMGVDEVRVILPPDERLVQDLQMVKRTEKYVLRNLSVAQQEGLQLILRDKQFQNQQRKEALQKRVGTLLAQATLVINGKEIEIGGQDGPTRVIQAFQVLLSTVYRNLAMLRTSYDQKQIRSFLSERTGLFGDDQVGLGEAEQELLNFLILNKNTGNRSTVKSLTDRFGAKPYGWPLAAVQCLLARLVAQGKVEMRRDSTLLEQIDDQEQAITSTHGAGNVLLDLPLAVTARQLRDLKTFFNEFFDQPPQNPNDARALGNETAEAFTRLRDELRAYGTQVDRYPFLSALDRPLETVEAVAGNVYSFYFKDLRPYEERLLTEKEGTIAPIRVFMGGERKGIYDNVRDYLAAQRANLTYVDGGEVVALRAILADPACFRGGQIQQAKSLLDSLTQRVTAAVTAVRQAHIEKVTQRWERLAAMGEFEALTLAQQETLAQPFHQLKAELAEEKLIAVIRDRLTQFDNLEYQGLLRTMIEWAAPPVPVPPADKPDDGGVIKTGVIKTKEGPNDGGFVALRTLTVDYPRAWLADETDVDAYVDALKKRLLSEIAQGKRVNV